MSTLFNPAADEVVHSASAFKSILRILCATDLSPRSERAVQRAVTLARQLDALLLLLHVVDERQSPDIIGYRVDRARSTLEMQGKEAVNLDISVRVGDPYKTIGQVSKQWDADLVILGSYRKRSGDQFFGTTAERVVRMADRAVLIVNRNPITPYRDVLLASDMSDTFVSIARMTEDLGLLAGARVSIVHGLGQVDRVMLYSAGVSEPHVATYVQSLRESSRHEILAQIDATGMDSSRFMVIQQHTTPFLAIERGVTATKPQLLVIGASRHPALKRLLGRSTANEVLRRVACDVLVASPAAVQQIRRIRAPRPAVVDLGSTTVTP
ncbi:MAG TPA: universal stress protein [Steroidobacteraceae bacterium]